MTIKGMSLLPRGFQCTYLLSFSRLSTCRINLYEKEDEKEVLYKGRVEINFNFNNSVLVQNHIKINDEHSETLVTEFWFSSKYIFLTHLCSNETGT
jgi:hypothetical protein